MTPDDKPFTSRETDMKTFTLRNSNEALVAAVAAFSLVSAAATVSLAPQMAQAADMVNDRPALTVHYSDLNLDTQAGAAVLYQRIRHAAEQVCGKADSRRLDEMVVVQNCMDKAIASSVSAVGNAQLTSQYVARAGKASKQIVLASAR
jgi:UrcA family protein